MITRKRINQYKKWFKNLSFFEYNTFILDYIEYLWSLVNYIEKKYKNLYEELHFSMNYSKLSKNGVIKLVDEFYKSHNIDLNVYDLINQDILCIKTEEKEKDAFFETKHDGESFYDENNNKRIIIKLEGTIFDAAVIIHELSHYRNQPDGKRNFISDLFTEALAYANALIFFEDLKDTKFLKDRNLHFTGIMFLMYSYVYNIHYIYKTIMLYKKENNITKLLHKKLFKTDDYDAMLNDFEKYVSQNRLVVRDTWFVIGLPLAIYMLEEYMKDKNFFDRLEKFNIDINEKSLWECLKAINVNGMDDLINKIKSSTNSYIETLIKIK